MYYHCRIIYKVGSFSMLANNSESPFCIGTEVFNRLVDIDVSFPCSPPSPRHSIIFTPVLSHFSVPQSLSQQPLNNNSLSLLCAGQFPKYFVCIDSNSAKVGTFPI